MTQVASVGVLAVLLLAARSCGESSDALAATTALGSKILRREASGARRKAVSVLPSGAIQRTIFGSKTAQTDAASYLQVGRVARQNGREDVNGEAMVDTLRGPLDTERLAGDVGDKESQSGEENEQQVDKASEKESDGADTLAEGEPCQVKGEDTLKCATGLHCGCLALNRGLRVCQRQGPAELPLWAQKLQRKGLACETRLPHGAKPMPQTPVIDTGGQVLNPVRSQNPHLARWATESGRGYYTQYVTVTRRAGSGAALGVAILAGGDVAPERVREAASTVKHLLLRAARSTPFSSGWLARGSGSSSPVARAAGSSTPRCRESSPRAWEVALPGSPPQGSVQASQPSSWQRSSSTRSSTPP
ncbi:unnamed protein product [Prorocentrum cordatum]|uniref:Subtilisin n=1 Tax=Prorocentrum cordatum TaxID=2364126 RepID=A0ABN9RSV8_9DINO|nr:unnamed protein product [Polarella glacialis]